MAELKKLDSKMAADHSDNLAEISLQIEHSFMSKSRIMKNLLILSLGFVFLFSAFMALSNLQSTMNKDGSVGVASQSAIYCALMLSTLFLPTLLIKRFGCKVTLVASMFTYSPYIAANFHSTMVTLLPTAILCGAGGAILWTSACAYINDLSFIDARGDAAKAALSTSKFFGIFGMFFQTTQIWGNLVSFYVLSPSIIAFENHENASEIVDGINEEISCGVDFCGGVTQTLSPVPDNQRSTLVGIYFALSIIAALVLLLFLDPLKRDDKGNDDSSLLQNLVATFIQIKETEQLLLALFTTFTGLEAGFIFADFSEAYVACTLGLQSVGLLFVCFGIVNSMTAFTTGRLLKYVPRIVMMLTAGASYIGVLIALFWWKPNIEQVSVFYILISFWAFSDAIWRTQLSALYGVLFRSNEEAAYASQKFFGSLGAVIAFSCSGFLCTSLKIYMQFAFLLAGLSGYITLEIRTFKKN